MNARARLRQQHGAALREQMELTRTQLLVANVGMRIAERTAKPRTNALTLPNIGRAFAAAPNVTLLASVVLGALILGPTRVAPLVVRTGLTAWVTRNVKAAIRR
ncbi:MAG TPA: hypothetical protein VL689_19140 [Paraburkholderia sp.]|jgi:hypothetical protein|nr:hypothetical protein [Paraburkholderia sp.]